MPLVRRIPKRGFTNIFRVPFQIVHLGDLDRHFADGETVTLAALKEKGLVRGGKRPVKILADGELSKKLTVQAHGFSASARSLIEAQGGSCEVVAS